MDVRDRGVRSRASEHGNGLVYDDDECCGIYHRWTCTAREPISVSLYVRRNSRTVICMCSVVGRTEEGDADGPIGTRRFANTDLVRHDRSPAPVFLTSVPNARHVLVPRRPLCVQQERRRRFCAQVAAAPRYARCVHSFASQPQTSSCSPATRFARVRGTVGLDVSENKHANTLV